MKTTCNKCPIGDTQKPLRDNKICADIMMVGLSAKISKYDNEIPLDGRTRSGKVIDEYEYIAENYGMSLYRTNIVKCAPLDKNKKLRYPKQNEIDICFSNFIEEIETVSPSVVVLLGDIVRNAVEKNIGIPISKPNENSISITQYKKIYIVTMYHPSYLLRSKIRKDNHIRMFENVLREIKEKKYDECNLE